MRFHEILRKFMRKTYRSSTNNSSLSTIRQPALYRFQSSKFSSNCDNNKIATSPLLKLQQSITHKFHNIMNDISISFWWLTATSKSHEEWLDEYNKQVYVASDARTGYLSITRINDAILRYKMRSLNHRIMCYEEFMIGAMNSFRSIQEINESDTMQISKCFSSGLRDEVSTLKKALFEDQQYQINDIEAFGSTLKFVKQKKHGLNLPDLEMTFVVGYHYSLQNKTDIKRKYAEVEWIGAFEPQLANNRIKEFSISDQGFCINNLEVDTI